jgi:hypothetical protein
MAKTMENNKAVKMLKAAEEGGYGVIGVVSVGLSAHFNVPFVLLCSLPRLNFSPENHHS